MKGRPLEHVSDSIVFDNWGFGGKKWLTVEHRHECADCSKGCDSCDLGYWFNEDCECPPCEALKVKHELMFGEDASPAALALLEFWATELVREAMRKADEELARGVHLMLLTEAQ